MARFVSTATIPQGGKANPAVGSTAASITQKDENRPFDYTKDFKQGEWNIKGMKDNLARKKAESGNTAYRDAYQMALTMAQQSGAQTDDELMDAGDQILAKLLSPDELAGINMRSIRNQVRGPVATGFDIAGDALDTVNNGIGGAIDWIGDNTIGNVVGLIGGEQAGNDFKNLANAQDIGGILSAGEDIGLWFLNPALAAGKAALDNRENIERAITGIDPLTLQQVDDGTKATSAGAAAVDIALSSLPGMGIGKAAIKQGAKKAGQEAEQIIADAARGAATATEKSAKSIKKADKEIRRLAEERGIKVPEKLDDKSRADILKQIDDSEREGISSGLNDRFYDEMTDIKTAQANAQSGVDTALQNVKGSHPNAADDFLNASTRNDYVTIHNDTLAGIANEEQTLAQLADDVRQNPLDYVWTRQSIDRDLKALKAEKDAGRLAPKEYRSQKAKIQNRKDDLLEMQNETAARRSSEEAGLEDVENLIAAINEQERVAASTSDLLKNIEAQKAPMIEEALGNITGTARGYIGRSEKLAKRAKNAEKKARKSDEYKSLVDDQKMLEEALENQPGILDRILTWTPGRRSSNADALETARRVLGADTAPRSAYIPGANTTRRSDLAGAVGNATLPMRNAVRARTGGVRSLINQGRGGTTQELNEQAARLMSENPKAINKLREIADHVSKNGGDAEKLTGRAKRQYEKLQKEYQKLVGDSRSYEDALESITKMNPIGQAYTRARQNALAESGSGLFRRYMGDAAGALGRGIVGMGDQALQLGAQMGLDPSTAMQDYAQMMGSGDISPALMLSLLAPGPKRFSNRLLGTSRIGGREYALPYNAARMNIMNQMINSDPDINTAIPTQDVLDWMRLGGTKTKDEQEG